MATVVPNLVTIAFTVNGVISAGARMYWFAAGTETPVSVYSDSTGVTPHANPIEADAGGVFPPVYANAGTYKVRIKRSAADGGATLYEVDNYAFSTGAGATLSFPTAVKTANFSVSADDRGKVFMCDASGVGTIIITANSDDLGNGFPFFVVNSGATGTVTTQGTGGQLINGLSTLSILTQYESRGLVSTGAAGWQVFSATSIQQGAIVVTATPATDQTDFTATGLSGAIAYKQINLAPTACINFNSIAGISEGERGVVCNTLDGTTSAGRMLIIPHEHAGSTAANRFNFADKMPRFLLPGESLSFIKFGSRLRLDSRSKLSDHFDVWSDCHTDDGIYISEESGTNAAAGQANYLVSDATQQPHGNVSLRTGTTSTGGASIGGRAVVDGLVPTKGQALFFTRVAVGALSNATDEYTVKAGFHDMISTGTDVTDGVYWEYLRTAATQWSMNCSGASSRSKTASSVAVDTNYVWLGIYINGDWSRAYFFISQDGRTYTWAGNQTGANMPTVTEIVDVKVVMKKSAGTTITDAYVDILAHRYDTYRGA